MIGFTIQSLRPFYRPMPFRPAAGGSRPFCLGFHANMRRCAQVELPAACCAWSPYRVFPHSRHSQFDCGEPTAFRLRGFIGHQLLQDKPGLLKTTCSRLFPVLCQRDHDHQELEADWTKHFTPATLAAFSRVVSSERLQNTKAEVITSIPSRTSTISCLLPSRSIGIIVIPRSWSFVYASFFHLRST